MSRSVPKQLWSINDQLPNDYKTYDFIAMFPFTETSSMIYESKLKSILLYVRCFIFNLQLKQWQNEYKKKDIALGKSHSDTISSILQQQ